MTNRISAIPLRGVPCRIAERSMHRCPLGRMQVLRWPLPVRELRGRHTMHTAVLTVAQPIALRVCIAAAPRRSSTPGSVFATIANGSRSASTRGTRTRWVPHHRHTAPVTAAAWRWAKVRIPTARVSIRVAIAHDRGVADGRIDPMNGRNRAHEIQAELRRWLVGPESPWVRFPVPCATPTRRL